MTQCSPQLSQICGSPGQSLQACFPFLKEACFFISAAMVLSLSFIIGRCLLTRRLLCWMLNTWVCPSSQQKTIFSYGFLTIAQAQFWKQSSESTKYYTQLAQLHTQYAERLRFCAQWNTWQNYIQYTFLKTTSCHHRKHTHFMRLNCLKPVKHLR